MKPKVGAAMAKSRASAASGGVQLSGLERSRIQERLVSLYLRLNGYFVTSFIVHSPEHGRNATELDALAIRHPFNAEDERQVKPDSLLDPNDQVADLVLCEVKNKTARFNKALVYCPENIASVLQWAGLFNRTEVPDLAKGLADAMNHAESSGPPTVAGPRGTRVRALLFSFESERSGVGPWFVQGNEVLAYVDSCLRPKVKRDTCSTIYNFQVWGEQESIVRYFKELPSEEVPSLNSLYNTMAG